jgi:hypothetical protein
MMVHVSAVLTQLIFDHSLKIRLSVSPSASASESVANMQGSEGSLVAPSGSSSVTIGVNDPASGSEAGLDMAKAAPQRSESPVPSVSSKSSKSSRPTTGRDKVNDKADSSDVVGKINNLIAVDVQNITDGRNFLFVCQCFTFSSRLSDLTLLDFSLVHTDPSSGMWHFPVQAAWLEVRMVLFLWFLRSNFTLLVPSLESLP